MAWHGVLYNEFIIIEPSRNKGTMPRRLLRIIISQVSQHVRCLVFCMSEHWRIARVSANRPFRVLSSEKLLAVGPSAIEVQFCARQLSPILHAMGVICRRQRRMDKTSASYYQNADIDQNAFAHLHKQRPSTPQVKDAVMSAMNSCHSDCCEQWSHARTA